MMYNKSYVTIYISQKFKEDKFLKIILEMISHIPAIKENSKQESGIGEKKQIVSPLL